MFYQRSLVFRVLDAFFRHRVIFLVSTITVIALITGFLVLRPKSYVGGYTVFVDNRTLTNPLADQTQNNWNDIDTSVSHLQTLISTQEFIDQALKNPDGTPVPLRYPLNVDDPEKMAELRKGITVADAANDAFTVTMEYKDPNDTKTILSSIITAYITQTAQEKSAFYSSDVAFIQQQVDSYHDKLTASEAALTKFKSQNANNLPSEQDAIEQQMVTYQAQGQDLQIQEIADQQRSQYLLSQLSHVPQTIIAAQTAGASPLLAQLQNLEVQLTTDVAVKQMKPTHPEVIALQQQIDRLKNVISAKQKTGDDTEKGLISTDTEPNPLYQSLQSQLDQVQIDQKTSKAKLDATMQLLGKATTGAALVPGAERTLANLERDYSTYSTAYTNLMARLQEAQMNEQLNLRQAQNAYTVLLTQPPVSSQGLSKSPVMLFGGIILALLIGATLVLLAELMDQSLRDPVDAQRVLDLPVLAVLPDSPVLNTTDRAGQHLLNSPGDDLNVSGKVLTGS